jgi:hypothetical protein
MALVPWPRKRQNHGEMNDDFNSKDKLTYTGEQWVLGVTLAMV